MTIYNIVGAPFPIDAPEFKDDVKVRTCVKQLENLIEIQYDLLDAQRALRTLRKTFQKQNQQSIWPLFECLPCEISDIILSYVVVLYAKAFKSSEGRTNLEGWVDKIFQKDKDKHDYMIDLRDKFYGHHQIEANKHQLFFLPNKPSKGKISFTRPGQTSRIYMSSWVNLEIVDFCLMRVDKYLTGHIKGLCKYLENQLSAEQLAFLTQTPEEELSKKYWRENARESVHPLSIRKS